MTIQHLGFRMYSHLPNALAELIANSYDADAKKVNVVISEGSDPYVAVLDDGHGMTPDELQTRYLRIGRNRVQEGEKLSESGRRRAAGRKGLGKLAPFGIGTAVVVRTKRRGSDRWIVVEMNWDDMLGSNGDYEPKVSYEAGELAHQGTSVQVRNLKRKTSINPDALAESLARLFNYTDTNFAIAVHPPTGDPIEVKRELRYESIEQETQWVVPDDVPVDDESGVGTKVSGVVIASVKPLPTTMRGLTIYVNGRLANDPEFYGASESSYASAYITGYIDADYLDDLSDDVVATDRRSISWESPDPRSLRDYLSAVLQKVGRLRRVTRRQAQTDRLKKQLKVDPEEWVGTIKGPERQAVAQVLEALVAPDTDLADGDRATLVEGMQLIAPYYAELHWRHLHRAVQASCEQEYKDGHYYSAVLEAIKCYAHAVENANGSSPEGLNAFENAFAVRQRDDVPRVDVMAPWGGARLGATTRFNIRVGQRDLSKGVWSGFRDPISHEERRVIEELGIFTYQDCLDALAAISHLYRRLDGALTS
jgi:uncharacterized protein (TIGR02391 family)